MPPVRQDDLPKWSRPGLVLMVPLQSVMQEGTQWHDLCRLKFFIDATADHNVVCVFVLCSTLVDDVTVDNIQSER